MTAVVVDTNPLLWWLTDPDQLTEAANDALINATQIYISAGTMLDLMDMLDPKGFAEVEQTLDEDPRYDIVTISFGVLTIASEHTPSIGPIRRAVLATALYNGCPLVTADEEISAFLQGQTELTTIAVW